ncbi:hypothetical protein VP01_4709g1 [Puccinia sorghi]|uniref:No apical meristem-associated C-terminal domain-containing protein n=1 Tax=Puccinia sorghi TaxID=27349 RepID=A0A0L6UQ05_9BASI|nr:hypothetical protein VP01_4709g1 [Puccinia sorghi]
MQIFMPSKPTNLNANQLAPHRKLPQIYLYCQDSQKKLTSQCAQSPSSEAQISSAAPSTPAPESDVVGAKVAHQEATKEDMWQTQVACSQEKLMETKHQNKILKKDSRPVKLISKSEETNTQLSIMTRDLTGLDCEQQEFFQLKHSEIIKQLRRNFSSNPTS